MGRTSLAAERRRHIVQVTIDCISTHGIRGATLERIAESAGMTRGHIRHYAGNRDELLTDAARVFYFGEQAIDEKDARLASNAGPLLDPAMSLDDALAYIFGEFIAPNSENPAAIAFLDASRTMPSIREIVLRAYSGISESLTEVIARAYPHATHEAVRRASHGIVALGLGLFLYNEIEISEQVVADARSIADDLISTLDR